MAISSPVQKVTEAVGKGVISTGRTTMQCTRVCGEKMVGLASGTTAAIAPCARKVAAVAGKGVSAAGGGAVGYTRKTVHVVNRGIARVGKLCKRK